MKTMAITQLIQIVNNRTRPMQQRPSIRSTVRRLNAIVYNWRRCTAILLAKNSGKSTRTYYKQSSTSCTEIRGVFKCPESGLTLLPRFHGNAFASVVIAPVACVQEVGHNSRVWQYSLAYWLDWVMAEGSSGKCDSVQTECKWTCCQLVWNKTKHTVVYGGYSMCFKYSSIKSAGFNVKVAANLCPLASICGRRVSVAGASRLTAKLTSLPTKRQRV